MKITGWVLLGGTWLGVVVGLWEPGTWTVVIGGTGAILAVAVVLADGLGL